eukprot:11210877-Lingulodinium_polyedra.AAC.1
MRTCGPASVAGRSSAISARSGSPRAAEDYVARGLEERRRFGNATAAAAAARGTVLGRAVHRDWRR